MTTTRTALVTGANRGLGQSIARALAAAGHRVVVTHRPGGDASETVRLIESAGGQAVAVALDLGDVASFPAFASELTASTAAAWDTSRLDVLVNNAGILRFAPLLEIDADQWDRTFAINTRSMLLTTQVAARAMIAAGHGGRIINLASMAGKAGGSGQADYAASKAAVIAFTRVTALELGEHGITANSLCPGYVLTEMGAATRTEADVAEWSSYSPLGRLGAPGDVAGVAHFLATDDAAYLTGQAFNVTGGMIMH